MHDAALHVKLRVEPIHVRPTQRECFTDAKTEAHAHKSNRVEWFLKLPSKPVELFHGQATWLPRSLRRTLNRDKFHRVPLHWYVTAPHSEVPQNTDEATDMHLAFRCCLPLSAAAFSTACVAGTTASHR